MGKKSRIRVIGRICAVLAMAGAATGCAADPNEVASGTRNMAFDEPTNKISGSVSEWKVDVSANVAEEGEVIFAIANFGTIDHEFLVTKTTYETGKIPVNAENRFDEEDPGIEVIDEIKEWPVNQAKVLKLDLTEGNYELLCNIAGHYANGMYAPFKVVKGEGTESEAKAKPAEEIASNDISGKVLEWEVDVDAHLAKAGEVNFTMENAGTIAHEFLVVKTDIAPGEIPLTSENKFAEPSEGLEVIDEIPEWPVGETKTLKLNLTPGNYQLVCNIEGHYKNGMHAAFKVE